MQHRSDRGRDGWSAGYWLLLLVAACFALPLQARAAPVLGATLLPAAQGAQGTQLAVSWRGADGVRLSATLRQGNRASLPLLHAHALSSGVNLLPLPLAADATGVLALEAEDAGGRTIATWERDLAKSRGDAWFAWESVFTGPGFDDGASVGMGGARHMVVWDDGNGPALYVGGGFLTAGPHRVNRIARWDGMAWSPLTGPLGTGIEMDGGGNPSVMALAVYDGDLVVAGYFDNAGGVRANNIARWDGSAWSALGAGLTGSIGVDVLTVYNGELVAGGQFTESGELPLSRIARWNGTQWSPLGSGISGAEFSQTPQVNALGVYGGELVAGGNFLDAGGVAVGRIARWNGSQWAALGEGVSEAAVPSSTLPSVNSLALMDGALIVGGNFRRAGGVAAGAVARWDGSTWAALGTGMTGAGNVRVLALEMFGGDLYAGGSFSHADGVAVNHVARWDGSQWSALQDSGGSGVSSAVETLAVFGNHLIAAGYSFQQAGGVVANGLARWDGGAWSTLDGEPGTGVAGEITASTVYQGDLVVAGNFGSAGGEVVHAIARWDGATWRALDGPFAAGVDSPPGAGVSPGVNALAVYDGDLVAGGRFLLAGGVFVRHVARWDGERWWPLGAEGSGVDGDVIPGVSALAVHDGALVVAGQFNQAGGVAADNIARWDGSNWSAFGSGTNDSVAALASFGGELVAGGNFSNAGGVAASGIARWNGTQWSPLGSGTDGGVLALLAHDGALFAAGNFSHAGGVAVNRVARWNGTSWSALAGPGGVGVDGQALALAEHAGELVVGGRFASAGGIPVNQVARWDGSDWLPLVGIGGAGVGGYSNAVVRTLAIADLDGAGAQPAKLVAAGRFHLTGGVANWNIGAYGPAAPLGVLDVAPRNADFGTVIAGWSTDPQLVTITSIGNRAVAVDAIPEPPSPFARIGGSCPAAPFELAPLASCTLEYAFAPLAGGAFEHAVLVDAQVDGATPAFNLIGAGRVELQPPAARVEPMRIDASLAPGETTSVVLSIGNAGDQALEWLLASAAVSSPAGFGDNIRAMVVWDDGRGPALYVAGEDDSGFKGVARWDGHAWSWLGGGMDGIVDALVVHAGTLVAGGQFSRAGGVTVNHVARWDGAQWSGFAQGLTGTSTARVNALAVLDGELYAGGSFVRAGAVEVNGIARWDGSTWSPLGAGLGTQVFALAVHDGALVAGGGFTTVQGQALNRIARWSGTAWSPLGAGLGSSVLALAVHDGALIAGGGFTTAGGAPANRIARWDGSTWSALGAGVNNQVGTLASVNGALVAAGIFTEAGGAPATRIARWDGSTWSPLGGGVAARVSALAAYGGALVAGGQFVEAGGIAVDHVARWDGATWSALVPGAPIACERPAWLAVTPPAGSIDPGAQQPLDVSIDTAGLAAGIHEANLCIDSNDESPQPTVVPVRLEVAGGGPVGQKQKLSAADGAGGDWYGRSVALDGDTALVGADAADVGANQNQGTAYVHVRAGGEWVQQARLVADDGARFNQFGISVALSGDTAVVGGGSGTDGAYVFTREGGAWTQRAKLVASDTTPADNFGIAVAIDGDTLVVGARQAMVGGNMNQGAAYVFVRDGEAWVEQAKLVAADGAAFDVFGDAVAIDGDTVVVGAAFADPGGHDAQGTAHVFTRSGTSWSEQARLVAADGVADDRFGGSVAVSGDRVLVGAAQADANAGAAWIFTRNGTTWSAQARLVPDDAAAGAAFGNAVALEGDTALVGAWFAGSTGATYQFSRSGSAWSQSHRFVSGDAAAGDQFGDALAIDGDRALIGAWLADVGTQVDQGAAYVFTLGGDGGGNGALSLQPGSVNFGTVPAGIVAGPAMFALTNTGTASVLVTAIDAVDAPFLRQGGDCAEPPFALAPSATCLLGYSFAPTATGSFSATVAVASDAGTVSILVEGTGIAGVPTRLVVHGGSGQAATVGTPFAVPLAAQVLDDWDNPVPGIGVTFGAPSSGPGATLSATSVVTDANGIAAVDAVANAEAGSYVVTAAGGLGAPVEFALTNLTEPADVAVSIVADREHAAPGEVINYMIGLHNAGPAAANGASIASALSAQLDLALATWICNGPVETGCTASGTGNLADSGLQLAAGGAVGYLLSAPVRDDAAGLIETSASATLADDPDSANNSASTSSIAVIFRDGFETAGASAPEASAILLVPGAAAVLPWPAPGTGMIEHLVEADACADHACREVGAAGFRIERFNDGRGGRLRLVSVDARGRESAGAWMRAAGGSELALSLQDVPPQPDAAPGQVLQVSAAGVDRLLPLPAAAPAWRLRAVTPVRGLEERP